MQAKWSGSESERGRTSENASARRRSRTRKIVGRKKKNKN